MCSAVRCWGSLHSSIFRDLSWALCEVARCVRGCPGRSFLCRCDITYPRVIHRSLLSLLFSDPSVTEALTAACLHGEVAGAHRKAEEGTRGSARHSLDGQSLRTAGQGAAHTGSPAALHGRWEKAAIATQEATTLTSASVANMADTLPQ